MTEKQSNKPAFIIYFVENFGTKEGEGKSRWTRIGAAWAHEDGKGFNPQFDLYPSATAKGRIVMRDAAEAEQQQKAA